MAQSRLSNVSNFGQSRSTCLKILLTLRPIHPFRNYSLDTEYEYLFSLLPGMPGLLASWRQGVSLIIATR